VSVALCSSYSAHVSRGGDDTGCSAYHLKTLSACSTFITVSVAAPPAATPSSPSTACSQVEAAVAYGRPVLLVDAGEVLDPALEPLLGKSYTRWGRVWGLRGPQARTAHMSGLSKHGSRVRQA
jgi:hypothetical protein